jgi:hypothetical protein
MIQNIQLQYYIYTSDASLIARSRSARADASASARVATSVKSR